MQQAKIHSLAVITAFVFLCALPLPLLAETAYVTDNLRLGLHQAPDTSDRAFRTLDSGQPVEVLSRDRNYANVTLPDGTRGYVKAAYLVDDKPAKLIVAETQAANEKLQQELAELKSAFAAPSATIAKLQSDLSVSQSAAEESEAAARKLSDQVEDFRSRQEQFKYSLPISWVGGAIVVALLGGFLFGLWWVDYRSRKRHGGIRIY